MAGKGSIASEPAMKAPKGRLTAAFVRSVSRSGVCCDQHGLHLRVYESRKRKSISKHWIWRGTVNGTRRDEGLGAFPCVSLLDARHHGVHDCREPNAFLTVGAEAQPSSYDCAPEPGFSMPDNHNAELPKRCKRR